MISASDKEPDTVCDIARPILETVICIDGILNEMKVIRGHPDGDIGAKNPTGNRLVIPVPELVQAGSITGNNGRNYRYLDRVKRNVGVGHVFSLCVGHLTGHGAGTSMDMLPVV